MTKILIGAAKDENGIYVPAKPAAPITTPPPPSTPELNDIDIDVLLQRGLRAIYGLMRAIEVDIGSGVPSRETVQNLKDANSMLWEFKKKEQEFLDSLSDEQLKEILKK